MGHPELDDQLAPLPMDGRFGKEQRTQCTGDRGYADHGSCSSGEWKTRALARHKLSASVKRISRRRLTHEVGRRLCFLPPASFVNLFYSEGANMCTELQQLEEPQ